MSLGTSSHYQTLQDACDAAYDLGYLLVAAAGNSGNNPGRGDNVGYPARYGSVVAVAASDDSYRRARWSSTGPDLELIAPGVSILSTLLGDTYGTASGTSMASPHVAGAAALAWAANPALANVDIRTILQLTAEDLGLALNHQGHGLARADLAVELALQLAPPAVGDIEGYVSDDIGDLIAGATVQVAGGTAATTDSDGYYLLENVAAGTRDVTASADGYGAVTHAVEVVDGETVQQDFALAPIPTYTVFGTVTGEGLPLEGASVTIVENGQSATTGDDGGYAIFHVEAGTYTITASLDGYVSGTATADVAADTEIDFDLDVAPVNPAVRVASIDYSTHGGPRGDRHLTVRITVVDDSENAVADASVSMALQNLDTEQTWTGSGVTGSDGTVAFSLNNAPSGTYTTAIASVTADGLEWDG